MTVFYWIYDIPTYQLAICMAVIFVGISWIGVILIRPLMRLFVLHGATTLTTWSATSSHVSASFTACYSV